MAQAFLLHNVRCSIRSGGIVLWSFALVLSFLAGLANGLYISNRPIKSQSPSWLPGNMHDRQHPNRLIGEKSPYLLQHAYNPVDWYPWGEDAFDKARREDKPIFLSIGYSTCYWCHVMEREVFENQDIARLMNENLVCIKVDREERPDIDRVYMTALQGMTGSGGWPMSMFLTTDLKPFFGATYIPPVSSYGRPGFGDLIGQITRIWKNERAKLLASADSVTAYLNKSVQPTRPSAVNETISDSAIIVFEKSYDPLHGGFGSAPKFPRPIGLEFLLRYYYRTQSKSALTMVLETLRHMAEGGVYDQLGGGFHRYSVDAEWRVPHFEKMLYDQAQLSILYTEAYQITHDGFYKDIADEILGYVISSMTDIDGGFYSAEDAESSPDPAKRDKKEEGALYLWTKDELDQALGKPDADLFCFTYGVNENGNVPHDPMNVFSGKNILYRQHTPEETAKQFNISKAETDSILRAARTKLLHIRSQRPMPHLDDKIITAWNGLMISAFAKAYQVFNDPRYLGAAEKAADFALAHLYDGQTLFRRYRDNDRRFEGTLQDYAFLVTGLLDLYEASFRSDLLEKAIDLTETQIQLFQDTTNGGFFDITGNDPTILLRTKENYDGAEPSGYSVAVMNLLRLGHITDNNRWKDLARRTIDAFSGSLSDYPESMPGLLMAIEWLSSPPSEIIITGSPENKNTKELLNEVYDRFLPDKILILNNTSNTNALVLNYLPFLKEMSLVDGKAAAYVCQNFACQRPITDPPLLGQLLSDKKRITTGTGQPENKSQIIP